MISRRGLLTGSAALAAYARLSTKADAAWLQSSATTSTNLIIPLNSNIAAVGDSIIANGYYYVAPDAYEHSEGPFEMASALSGGVCRKPLGANAAVGGTTSAQIAASIPALSSISPAVLLLEGGINDDHATPSVTIANWQTMIANCRALGAVGIILPILPRTDDNAQDIVFRNTVNAFLLTQAARDMLLVNVSGWNPATMIGGTVHPNNVGAYYLGQQIAAVINQYVPSGNVLYTSQTGTDNLLPGADAFFTSGTGGSLTNCTGTVATNWGLTRDAQGTLTGITCAASLVSNPNGGNWQQMVVGGSGSGLPGNAFIELQAIESISSLAAGQTVEGFCEYNVGAGVSGVYGVQFTWELLDSGYADIASSTVIGANSLLTTDNMPSTGYYGIARSGVMPIASTPAHILARASILMPYAGGNLAPSINLQVGRFGLRRVS